MAQAQNHTQNSSQLDSRIFSSELINQRFNLADNCLALMKEISGVARTNEFIEKINQKTQIVKLAPFSEN